MDDAELNEYLNSLAYHVYGKNAGAISEAMMVGGAIRWTERDGEILAEVVYPSEMYISQDEYAGKLRIRSAALDKLGKLDGELMKEAE